MTEQTNTTPAAPAAPQQSPVEQRAALMADATFRAGAMDPKGPKWAQIVALDTQIAELNSPTDDEAPAASGTKAHAQAIVDAHESGDDQDEAVDQALAFINKVPDRPGLYDLPSDQARSLGLKIDGEREGVLRQAFHAAEVPQSLAALMYTAAITAAKNPDQSEAGVAVRQQAEYLESASTLHQKWGAQYESNLASANAEARRIFEKLPASLTNGVSYADWCRSSGIANNRVVVEALVNLAKARTTGAKVGR